MKKLKIFAVVSGIALVATGVVAGKSKFFAGYYAYDFANQVV